MSELWAAPVAEQGETGVPDERGAWNAKVHYALSTNLIDRATAERMLRHDEPEPAPPPPEPDLTPDERAEVSVAQAASGAPAELPGRTVLIGGKPVPPPPPPRRRKPPKPKGQRRPPRKAAT